MGDSMRTSAMAHRPANIAEVADILATGFLRLRLRDVRNQLKKNRNPEKDLEVSSPKSLHRLEPQHGEEKR
jgi:hypothetical protein